MENHDLILALLRKYRPDHIYQTDTNENGVVELVFPYEKFPLRVPLDAEAKWCEVKRMVDMGENYVLHNMPLPSLEKAREEIVPLGADIISALEN